MSKAIPSPQTLRYLRRLCASEPSLATSIVPASRTRQSPLRCAVSRPTYIPQRAFTTSIYLKQGVHSHPQPQSQPEATSISPQENDTSLPDITSYYTLFPGTLPRGPPPSSPFEIPLPTLRREFLLLQSKYHPDKFPSGTMSHQKSLALSSLLNTAYKTLSDPLLRARYLLVQNYGIDVTSEDNSIHSGLTDQATLLDVMEAQEALEAVTTYQEIESLMDENSVRINKTEKILGEAFGNEDVDSAKRECVRLNYWRSLQSALREWEPGKEVRLVH